MIEWVQAGFPCDPLLPAERLTPDELGEVVALVRERSAQVERLTALDQKLALVVTAARDRRGLTGPVRIHAGTGDIQRVDEAGGSHGG